MHHTKLLNIESIVQNVLNKNYNIPVYDIDSYILKNSIFNLIELKTVLTNFISDKFFTETVTFENFFNIINSLFTNAIDIYIGLRNLKKNDIFFLYKGGNIFNLYWNNIITQFPNFVNQKLIDEYSNFFKKTDCDFSIIINPTFTIEVFNNIHNDMTNLSFLLLNRIRNIFLLDKQKYFDIYKFNNDYQIILLNNVINKLNSTIDTFNNNNDLFECEIFSILLDNIILNNQPNIQLNKINSFKNDLLICNNDHTKSANLYSIKKINTIIEYSNSFLDLDYQIQNCLINNSNSEFYITYNKNIEYIANNNLYKFSLIRMKINFLCYYFNKHNVNTHNIINLPGELIDISIPYINSSEHLIFYKNLNNNIVKINYLSNQCFMFTIEYLISDVYNIIIERSYFPWTDCKYLKRLQRLMFLYLFNTLNKYTIIDTCNIIRNILTNIDLINNIQNKIQPDDTYTLYNVLNLILIIKNRKNNRYNDFNPIFWKDFDPIFFNDKYFIDFIDDIKKSLNIFVITIDNLIKYNNSPKLLINELAFVNIK